MVRSRRWVQYRVERPRSAKRGAERNKIPASRLIFYHGDDIPMPRASSADVVTLSGAIEPPMPSFFARPRSGHEPRLALPARERLEHPGWFNIFLQPRSAVSHQLLKTRPTAIGHFTPVLGAVLPLATSAAGERQGDNRNLIQAPSESHGTPDASSVRNGRWTRIMRLRGT
jgi:hypothetical protein